MTPQVRSGQDLTASRPLASLLLDGLSDQDLAVFARRLLPHLLRERQIDPVPGHAAYTVASLAAELRVSAKAIRCAIARHGLQAVKHGRAGSSRQRQFASGRLHGSAARRLAGAPRPPRTRQGHRCGQCSAEGSNQQVPTITEVRDERGEGKPRGWRGGVAGAVALGEYVIGTWAASHGVTLAPKTRVHCASFLLSPASLPRRNCSA